MRGMPAVSISLFVVACGAAEQGSERAVEVDPVVRDSSGVAIVENIDPARRPDLRWSLSPEPILSLGSLGDERPEEAFGEVRDAGRLSDGRVLVLDAQTQNIKVFSENGTYLDTWGRRGEGPGEFSGVWRLWVLPGDTIAVPDRGARATHYFTPRGDWIGSARFPLSQVRSPGDGVFQSCCVPEVPLHDGSVVWRFAQSFRNEPVWQYARAESFLVQPSGEVDTVRVGPTTDGGRQRAARADLSGRLAVTTNGNAIVYGTGERPEYQIVAPSGRLERIVRWSRTEARVSASDAEDYHRRYAEWISPEGVVDPAVMERVRGRPISDVVPTYGYLVGDGEGRVWVLDHWNPFDQPAEWPALVFGPDGRWLGHAILPSLPRQIANGFLVTTRLGDLDEAYVDVWAVEEPRIR